MSKISTFGPCTTSCCLVLHATPVLAKMARVLKVSMDALLDPSATPSAGSSVGGATSFDVASPALLPGLHPTTATPSLTAARPLGPRIAALACDYLAREDICLMPEDAEIAKRLVKLKINVDRN